MILVAEQQTFAKLRLAPMDFVELLDKDPEKALEYITQLQGEREKQPTRKGKIKDPNDLSEPKPRGKRAAGIDLLKVE